MVTQHILRYCEEKWDFVYINLFLIETNQITDITRAHLFLRSNLKQVQRSSSYSIPNLCVPTTCVKLVENVKCE